MNDVKEITELVLSELYSDTFENYNEDNSRIITVINGLEIGYRHDGKTLTHDIFVHGDACDCKVTGDIRANREQLANRVYRMLNNIFE